MSRSIVLAAAAGSSLLGCLIITPLEDLARQGDAGSGGDASTDAADAGTDAGPDASQVAIALVQKAQWSNSAPYKCGMPAAVGAGNTLVALTITSPPDSAVSVSDSLGQTWKSSDFSSCANEMLGLRFFYVESSAAGADTVTMKLSGSGTVDGIAVLEYAGIGALEAQGGLCANGSLSDMKTASVTTSGPGLLISAFTTLTPTGPTVPGTGWTLQDDNDGYYAWQDRITSAAGTYQGTATQANNATWTSLIVAFKKR